MVELKDKIFNLLRRPETLMGMGIVVVILAIIGIIGTALSSGEAPSTPTITPTAALQQYTPSVATFTPTPTLEPVVTQEVIPTLQITPTPAVTTTHTVKEGDTLLGIALTYNVTVEVIKTANGMSDDTIYPGDVLVIPAQNSAPPDTTTPPADGTTLHTVAQNETLGEIALRYGVTTDALLTANHLDSADLIQVGQQLVIPTSGTTPGAATPTPTPAAAAPPAQPWAPSILEGNLSAAYPQTVERTRYTLHYPPDGLPAQEVDAILSMVDTTITQIEMPLSIHLQGHFDVYVAGSLFAPPDLALRGRSFSSNRRLFFLWDGTGDAADRQYIITHESTHTFTWNAIGAPASVMLHEGVAVFTGMPNYENAGYISLQNFCAAYYKAGKLPLPSDGAPFMGHIYDLANYYSAGGFVRYLIQMYGAEKFAKVYTSANYSSVYGETLTALQDSWLATLETTVLPAPLDPDTLVSHVEAVQDAYTQLFDGFNGTSEQMNAYRVLDQARISVLAGRFAEADAYLETFRQYNIQ
ncbi:MAG: LysM peptidoglycan-binding domain-containing protein [Anaerolineae bacterium]|nr:LysM peptidoglycan-binding domain-containing protein [Anaerolineae bacterium]